MASNRALVIWVVETICVCVSAYAKRGGRTHSHSRNRKPLGKQQTHRQKSVSNQTNLKALHQKDSDAEERKHLHRPDPHTPKPLAQRKASASQGKKIKKKSEAKARKLLNLNLNLNPKI